MPHSTLAPLCPEIAAQRLGFLPAPFEDIRFQWDVDDCYIQITYRGSEERLLECGAIEPQMARRREKGEPKPRRDSAGHHFIAERKVIRQPLSIGLEITRYIFEPRFAETLPGIPPGLRFKRLDWLDAHPGAVHTETFPTKIGRIRLYSAGTRESLLAVGFGKSGFRSKLLERPGHSHFVCGNDELGDLMGTHKLCSKIESMHANIRRLMRGYFEVEVCYAPDDDSKSEKAVPRARPKARPKLSLVIDNTVKP
jgi:hypothetical protein